MSLDNSTVVPFIDSGAAASGNYSLRFNDDDSAYLSRTPSSAGNRKTWTWSAWIKRSAISNNNSVLFGAGNTSNPDAWTFGWVGNYVDQFVIMKDGSYILITDAKYRDSGAWYHIVIKSDTTQSTATNRLKLYINGEEVTSFATDNRSANISQNEDWFINGTSLHTLGKDSYYGQYHDGYMAEVYHIDGTALDASSFGETNSTYGNWQPIEYTGSYGTNGFHLTFSNSSNLGDDEAGSNDWSATNLAAADIVLDSPTNNFATFAPLHFYDTHTLSEGNLKLINGSSSSESVSSIALSSGKWYAEFNFSSKGSNHAFGIRAVDRSKAAIIDSYDGTVLGEGGSGTAPTTGIIGIAINADSKSFTVYDDNSAILSNYSYSSWPETDVYFSISKTSSAGSDTIIANFGQDGTFAGTKTAQSNSDDNGYGNFYYAPPSGYLALCTANLPEPDVTPTDNFNTVIYSGNGTSSNTVTGVGFQPEVIWHKCRSHSRSWRNYDIIRGLTNKDLRFDTTGGESTWTWASSITSDGFVVSNSDTNFNASGYTYAAHCLKANGSGSSNTNGSTSSSVSANQDAGFSIVSWTGTGSLTTIGHGLTQTPNWIIVKNRTDGDTNWVTLENSSLATDYQGYTNNAGMGTGNLPYFFGNTSSYTAPTSSVFTVGANNQVNGSGDAMIAYCFHSVPGYSKAGNYNGVFSVGASGDNFIWTGFKPAFVISKCYNATEAWPVFDNKRAGYNPDNWNYWTTYSNAEQQNDAYLNIYSNGFSMDYGTGDCAVSGKNYIYFAIAEQPFKYTNAR